MVTRTSHWRALGTTVDLIVETAPRDLDRAAGAAEAAVRAELDAVDRACSRFRFDSELSRLHDYPDRAVPVSRLLFEALDVALRAARLTDGAVDPTVGGAIRRLGYDRDFDLVTRRSTVPRLVAERVPGWRAIQLDRERRTVRVRGGVEIDLGSTGKALAADRSALAAHRAAGCSVLVSLGGDVATAGPPPRDGWRVLAGETSATRPEDAPDGEVITIGADAVATSSTTVRRWGPAGTIRHHILDPRTGLPTSGPWRTVTVVARSCVDANTASTAAIVRGADASAWLATVGLPARLVANDGHVIRVAGWPMPLERAS